MAKQFLWQFSRKAETIFGARIKNGLFIKKRCKRQNCLKINLKNLKNHRGVLLLVM